MGKSNGYRYGRVTNSWRNRFQNSNAVKIYFEESAVEFDSPRPRYIEPWGFHEDLGKELDVWEFDFIKDLFLAIQHAIVSHHLGIGS